MIQPKRLRCRDCGMSFPNFIFANNHICTKKMNRDLWNTIKIKRHKKI